MLLLLDKVLSSPDVERIVSALAKSDFSDGKLTAGGPARDVKNNRQLLRSTDVGAALGQQVIAALTADHRFRSAAVPHTFVRPMFSRYDEGMEYGDHLDAPFMEPARIRTDVSITVFLCGASAYDGGELTIDSDYGAVKFKGNAGDVLLYPSSSVHRVERVTRGSRLVSVLWVQSMVRDPARRKILYDLHMTTQRLSVAKSAGEEELETLRKCHANLLRMWAER